MPTASQRPDGTWGPSEPLHPTGIIGRTEAWARRHGWTRTARILAHLDERGMGR